MELTVPLFIEQSGDRQRDMQHLLLHNIKGRVQTAFYSYTYMVL